ncbi:MAG: ATP-binding protein [Armatimonadota bacterium]
MKDGHSDEKLIGRVVATEEHPNTAFEFQFWADKAAKIGIGSIVEVVDPETGARAYGIVTEANAYNDAPNAMSDYLGSQRRPNAEGATLRPEIRTFKAAVLRREPEEPIGAAPIGCVFLADDEAVRKALRCDEMVLPIPVGVYGGEDGNPVFAEGVHLLGPESGHLNVTGTSGLAAKTSYILFLLTSIFQRFGADASDDTSVAAVVFNVKGTDLLYLDQASESLSDGDMRIYEACGLEPKPFENVVYYAPSYDDTGEIAHSYRSHKDLQKPIPFSYGPEQVLEHIEVLLNQDDVDAKADSLLGFLRHGLRDGLPPVADSSGPVKVTTLAELVDYVEQMMVAAEGNQYKGHHARTIQKIFNRLSGLANRFPGLIASRGEGKPPLPRDKFQDRTVYVIDIAKLDADHQDLVFAAVIADLRERMSRGGGAFGVSRLIVVVDELNKFAPSSGRETYTMRALRDIAARGRYQGLILFGAQQFRSRVDPQIVGNCSSSAYGHILMEELANPIYSPYPPAVREKMANCQQGQVMFRHPHFAQPIFVRFPRPAVLKGEDGVKRFPPTEPTPLDRLLSKLRPAVNLQPNDIIEAVNEAFPVEEDRERGIMALLGKLKGVDVALLSKSGLRKLLQECGGTRKSVATRTWRGVDELDDPFAEPEDRNGGNA